MRTHREIGNTDAARGIGVALALCYAVGNIALILVGALWFGELFRGGWIALGALVALLVLLLPPGPPKSHRMIAAKVVAFATAAFLSYLLATMPRTFGQYDIGHAVFLVQLAFAAVAMPFLIRRQRAI